MTKKHKYRALAPASSAASPTSNPERKDSSSSARGQASMSTALPKKRSPVPVACRNCQKRKSKCSGQRPTCSSCGERGLECIYDIKDSAQGLRNTVQELTGKLNEYERALTLIHGSSNVEEIHGVLESLKLSAGWVPQGGSYDEGAGQGSTDNPAMVLSPTSSESTMSPESQDPFGQWQLSRSLTGTGGHSINRPQGSMAQDSPVLQERSDQMSHLELFGNVSLLASNLVGQYQVAADRMRVRVPEHLVQPLWTTEKSPLSQAYVEFRDAALNMIASGTPAEQILGPDFVSVALFFRKREPSDGYTVSSWACEMVKSFEMIDVHVRLALAVLFTYLMRWMLDPTLESYQRVPTIIRPTPSQRLIPHAPMIDLAITAPIREALCRKARDWTSMMEKYIRFDWPFQTDDCFEFDETTGAKTRLTAEFAQCAADVKRWSFKRSILNEWPELAGQVSLHDTI